MKQFPKDFHHPMFSIYAMISPFGDVINEKPINIEEIDWIWFAIEKKQILQAKKSVKYLRARQNNPY